MEFTGLKPLLVRYFLAFVAFFVFRIASGQPTAGFSTLANACLKQNITFSNTSSSASRYEWDMCPYDLDSLSSDQTVASISGLLGGYGYELVEDNGTWYGFAVSQQAHSVYRLDFGSSPLNTPTVVTLGNPGGILEYPMSIAVYKNGSNWYGFVGAVNQDRGLTRLDFGTSITNMPSAQNLGMFGQSGRYFDVRVVNENGNLALVLPLRNGVSSIVVVNYRNSFDNPINTSTDVYSTGPITGLDVATSLDLVKSGNDWIALVASNSTNSIFQYRFPSTILATPVQESVYSTNLDHPLNIRILQEADRYVAAVTSESAKLKMVNFHDLNPATTPAEISHSSLLSLTAVALHRYKGTTIAHALGLFINQVHSMVFKSYCKASSDYTETNVPSGLTYTAAGKYPVELRAFNSQDINSSASHSIQVSSLTSPDIDFSSQNVCAQNTINFTSANVSGGLTNYSWNFGDGGSSAQANPGYIYSSGATYNAALTVTAGNACQNTAQKSIQVFNPPQANFTLPAANPICTNQTYGFNNTTTYDNGSNPTWQWSVNGSNVNTTQNLNYKISSPVAQAIKLTASLPGCSSQITQNINTVQVGPLLSFTSPVTSCVATTVTFTNTSSGSVLGYSWAFGDGNASSQTSPSYAFASNSLFNVTLSASNAAGCQNSYSQFITIYSNPKPDFFIDAPPFSCEKSPSQLNDNTPGLPDSNLAGWSWQFGDAAGGTSQSRNPAYTYSTAADYNVNLTVTSNFGCIGSKQKTVTIAPSPLAAFNNTAACVNQVTQFTDATTGSLKSRLWKIQTSSFTSPTPTFTFNSSGTYPVILSVTGNNNCINQLTQNVVVPVAPVMDFSIQYPCSGSVSQLQETNPGGSDPATAWNWNFTSGNGSGNPTSYTFASSGGYTVTLTSTRQSKCIYSVSKNVSIVDGPVAAFTPSVGAGAAPLPVNFTNNSNFASTYAWTFGDPNNSVSSDPSPSFTYQDLGTYNVTLTASNVYNCTSTATGAIHVVVPNLDAALTSLQLANDPLTSSKRAVVTIANNSNIPLVNPAVSVNLGGNVWVKETVVGTIPAGSSLTRTLAMEIVPTQISYVCAEINIPNDVFAGNDEQCVPLTQEEVLLPPYPNPASVEFSIDWITPTAQDIHVAVFKSNGEVAFDQQWSAAAGLTQYKINTSSWASGLYLVRLTGAKTQIVYKVVVAN